MFHVEHEKEGPDGCGLGDSGATQVSQMNVLVELGWVKAKICSTWNIMGDEHPKGTVLTHETMGYFHLAEAARAKTYGGSFRFR